MFSKRYRILLACIGLLLIVCSLVTLSFAARTPDHIRSRQTIVPTLLAPPLDNP